MSSDHFTTRSTKSKATQLRLSLRTNCYLDFLLIVIIQKKFEPLQPCDICGKIVSRAKDFPGHMKTHDPSAKFVCISLIVIDTYFVGNPRVLGMGCTATPLFRNLIWTHYRRQCVLFIFISPRALNDASYCCYNCYNKKSDYVQ